MRRLILTTLAILFFAISSFSQLRYESSFLTSKRYSTATMRFETVSEMYKPTQISIDKGISKFVSGRDTLTLYNIGTPRQTGDMMMIVTKDTNGVTAILATEVSKKDPEDVKMFEIMYKDKILVFEQVVEVVPKVL